MNMFNELEVSVGGVHEHLKSSRGGVHEPFMNALNSSKLLQTPLYGRQVCQKNTI